LSEEGREKKGKKKEGLLSSLSGGEVEAILTAKSKRSVREKKDIVAYLLLKGKKEEVAITSMSGRRKKP